MSEEEQRHRVVLLGAGQVGKSSIVARFLNGSLPKHYKATVEDLHCKDYSVNGTVVKVDFLDTAGDLVFPAMRRLSISTAHAFILVFAIDDPNSFAEVKSVWEQIKEQRSNYDELPCVVVGNKSDLDLTAERRVPVEEPREWVALQGMDASYMEVSAKEDRGILHIFEKLLEQANIPQVRKLEPVLKRRLSANAANLQRQRDRLRSQQEDGGGSAKLSRSRSLMRRTSKPKVKHTGDMSHNDCCIS